MAEFLVTQALWKALMKSGNPSRFKGDTRPVEWISWDETRKFIKALNNAASRVYRLPSEAEWEYAARGRKYSEDYLYAGSDKLSEVGWYNKNSRSETRDVGQLLPNELGIYDLSGNVWEWCEDDYHKNYEGAPADGSAWVDHPQRGAHRVIRGGSWVYDAQHCRISSRHNRSPGGRHDGGIGFRLVLSPSQLAGS